MSTILFLKARGDPEASSTMYGKKAPSSVCFRSAPRLPTVGLGTNSLLAEAAQLYPKLVQISGSQPSSLYPNPNPFSFQSWDWTRAGEEKLKHTDLGRDRTGCWVEGGMVTGRGKRAEGTLSIWGLGRWLSG